MELERNPAQETDVQTSPIIYTHMKMYSNVQGTNIKQEPEYHTNDDLASFSDNTQYSGNVGMGVEIKTEVRHTDEYGNRNILCGSANCDGSKYISNERSYDTNAPVVKSEPVDESLDTANINAFIIEIDTCKDEYYEPNGYPTKHGTVVLQESQREDVRTVSAINMRPCTVTLSDTRYTYPVVITQCSVRVQGTGDEQCKTYSSKIIRHVDSDNVTNMHVCPDCPVVFSSKYKLTKHALTHKREQSYRCHVCERSFGNTRGLTDHIRRHTGEKPYRCSVCEVGFTHKCNLKTHTRIHTGERPYTCLVCEVSYTDISSLIHHKRIHTGEKPHKCSICEVGFLQKSHLAKHMRIHTGEKPYICSYCGVGFTQKGSLKIHTRKHTGEKPHSCPACGVSFSDKRNLIKHIRVHIGKKAN